jgi:hypothetical protein
MMRIGRFQRLHAPILAVPAPMETAN